MNDWEYIPFRAAQSQADELNDITDEYGLNRSTALRIMFRFAVENRDNRELKKALAAAAETGPRSRPRGTRRKDKRS